MYQEGNVEIEIKKSKIELFKEYILTNSNKDNDIYDYLKYLENQIIKLIGEMKLNNNNIKGQLSLECTYTRILVGKKTQNTSMNFNNKSNPIYNIL